jgi:hypothetical protein
LALSERAWKHIRERHPETSGYKIMIKDVVGKPDFVVRGLGGVRKAVRWLQRTHLGPKYIVVVYRGEGSKKDIITAYFTSDLKKVKGEVEWKA